MQEREDSSQVSTAPPAAADAPPAQPAPAKPVARWALHRRLYDWMLSFSYSPRATLALFVFSFIEAIFFPIPPFVLQIPLTLERRSRAWWYAGVTTVASVAGGVVGYLIGLLFQDWVRGFLGEGTLRHLDEYSANVALLTAAVFVIHPYKIYTIAAGLLGVPLLSFVVASLVGRAGLFFGIAALLWLFGPPIRTLIDKYFNLLTIALGALIIAAVVVMKVV